MGQLQNVITLIVDGVPLNLACDPVMDNVLDYISERMLDNGLCVLQDAYGKRRGIFRGSQISGVYPTQIDSEFQAKLHTLQIENLQLQNQQLKDSLNEGFWKHGHKFE